MQKSLRKGEYLWELISPKEKDGLPARSTTGRYRVKLFLLVSTVGAQLQQLEHCMVLSPGRCQHEQPPMHACHCLTQCLHAIPVQDTWRTVTVDDRIPLDLFGGCFGLTCPCRAVDALPNLQAHQRQHSRQQHGHGQLDIWRQPLDQECASALCRLCLCVQAGPCGWAAAPCSCGRYCCARPS